MDKGAFGQVVKCYDHKNNESVAIKINRNSAFDHNNSRIEIKLLNKLVGGQVDDAIVYQSFGGHLRVVNIKEQLFFRNHYCMVFELLERNLFHDLQ